MISSVVTDDGSTSVIHGKHDTHLFIKLYITQISNYM